MTLADVCDELEEALEALSKLESRQGDDYSSTAVEWCERCIEALVVLGEQRIDYAIEAGSFYGSDGEQRHGARWDALNYDRFASLKAQAKEVLGG